MSDRPQDEGVNDCPNCGNPAHSEMEVASYRGRLRAFGNYFVACGTCENTGPHCGTESEAIKQWNAMTNPA